MYPTLRAGDFVLLWRWTKINEGDIIVAKHLLYGNIIKRVKNLNVSGSDLLELSGDNQLESTSSQQLGYIHHRDIIGKVIWHIQQ